MRDRLMAMNPKSRITLLLSCFFLSFVLMVFKSDYWLPFFALMLFFLALLISTNSEYDKNLRNKFDDLAKETLVKNNFHYDDFYIGDDKLTAIAINEHDKKLVIIHRTSIKNLFTLSPIDFSDIIESSIIEDGETISKSSKGSVLGGAIVGSVIAGGIGATIGGLSADRTIKDKVKKITLMIIVNNLSNPVYEVNFLNIISPIDKATSLYKLRYSNVTKWHKIISIILKRNELNSKSI